MSAVSPPRRAVPAYRPASPARIPSCAPVFDSNLRRWHGRSVIGFAGRGDEPIYFVLLYSALAIEPIL
jgi:hypothetical protein